MFRTLDLTDTEVVAVALLDMDRHHPAAIQVRLLRPVAMHRRRRLLLIPATNQRNDAPSNTRNTQ